MRKSYLYRAYANKQTIETLGVWLELCRNLYNCALEQRKWAWKYNHKHVTLYDQIKELPELRKAYPEYKNIDAQALREPLKRIEWAFRYFFSQYKKGRKCGLPRYKGKNRYDSLTFEQNGWKLDGKYLHIRRIGILKLKLSRPIEGRIKTITIRRNPSNKWYVSFSCDSVPQHKLPEIDSEVGMDVGIKSFLVDSEGKKVEHPHYLRNSIDGMKALERRLSRRKRGSHRRQKARVLLAKAREKVTNQRRDFLNKVALDYVRRYGVIYIEKLTINYMIQNPCIAQDVVDSAWGKFFKILSCKAEDAGRTIIQVASRNTSQICSRCGEKVKKTLSVRIHSCPYCGLVMDRDENAAINILRVGQTRQALTKGVAICVA